MFGRKKYKKGDEVVLIVEQNMSYGIYKIGAVATIESLGYKWEKYPILLRFKKDQWIHNGNKIPYGYDGSGLKVNESEIKKIN